MCASLPYHAVLPVGTIYGAIDQLDGSIEVIGTRPGDYPFQLGPVETVFLPGDQCVPHGFPSIPLVKWTIETDGTVNGPSDFNSQPNATHGFAGIFSPDGSWLAGNLPPTTCGGAGLPIIWHPGQADYVLVGLPADRPADRAVIQGVSNNGSVIYHIDQEYFAWNQDTGLVPLRSLYDLEDNQSPEGRQTTLYAISADGQTIVGTSGGSGELLHRPTVWRNGAAFALPTGGYSAGFAASVSDDGRVIGGNLRDGTRMIPAVWVDGILQQIPEISGSFTEWPNIIAVDSGLADDPNGWAALGWDSGRVFVVRSDGVVHEFYRDDPDNFGVSADFIGDLRHFSADGDSVNIVTYNFSLPAILGCFGCQQDLTPRATAHVVSIPLSGSLTKLQQYDLNDDGAVSPLDALIIINAINDNPGRSLTDRPELRQATPKIDVDGDGELLASDALTIINFLNANHAPLPDSDVNAAEGEGGSTDSAAVDDVFDMFSEPARKNGRQQR